MQNVCSPPSVSVVWLACLADPTLFHPAATAGAPHPLPNSHFRWRTPPSSSQLALLADPTLFQLAATAGGPQPLPTSMHCIVTHTMQNVCSPPSVSVVWLACLADPTLFQAVGIAGKHHPLPSSWHRWQTPPSSTQPPPLADPTLFQSGSPLADPSLFQLAANLADPTLFQHQFQQSRQFVLS